MKWFSCYITVFVFLISVNCFAQTHFIYIQSDDKQPFSAGIDSHVYNSSETGYIIISKLNEGEHEIKITAITKNTPEQSFKITVGKRDAGYGLTSDNTGLHLYNLRTKKVVGEEGNAQIAATETTNGENSNTSMFAQILSEVVNDPDLTKKIDYSKIVIQKDIVYSNGSDTPAQQAFQTQPVLDDSAEAVRNTAAADTRGIIKDNEADGKEGKEMTFIEFNSTGNDTIHVTIPFSVAINETSTGNVPTPVTNINENNNTDTSQVKPVAETGAVTNPFFNKDSTENNNIIEVKSKPAVTNTTCDKILSDDELYKLKRKLFTEPDHDKMLNIFKKNVKNKCVTTEQVKALGSYFLSDESRFNFYTTASTYVSDYNNYASLESQLFDKSIRQQFHQLVNNKQN